MSVPTTVMLDTIGANAGNVPLSTHYVGVYVTGSGDVPWSAEAIKRFAASRIVRIEQGVGPDLGPHQYDMIDVENGAVTPQRAAQMVNERVHNGVQWTTIYGTDATLAQCTDAIKALGEHVWNGHVNYVLADWNLNALTAAAKVGTEIHGASCVGVQWASPESNPNTMTPGGDRVLSQTNVDISVVDANWIPSGGFTGKPVVTPIQHTYTGLLVTTDSVGTYHARAVTSHDDITWQ